jgi:hypothetical protein
MQPDLIGEDRQCALGHGHGAVWQAAQASSGEGATYRHQSPNLTATSTLAGCHRCQPIGQFR